ncbi:glycosyltransferase [Prochlorococcus sp. MIT 1011]|uniref:glycosyltransferase n=1 Tax=Prochlorococcus sp. MIT 1011 TaxID=3082520 RepID=UPI0039B3B29D
MTKKYTVFIIIPSFSNLSPIAGAAAFANKLCDEHDVSIIALKKGNKAEFLFDKRCKLIDISNINPFQKYLYLRNLFSRNSCNTFSFALSICFSADFYTSFFRSKIFTITSVRGDLPVVYKIEFGYLGPLISFLHINFLRRFHVRLGLTKVMVKKISSLTNRPCFLLPNFIDEKRIETYFSNEAQNGETQFIFIGSITTLKSPITLVKAFVELENKGYRYKLDIVGEGPLFNTIVKYKDFLKDSTRIVTHGFLINPFPILSKSNILVLPSLTEGISRSMLEALYLGVFCIIRDNDSSAKEYIQEGVNGFTFRKDSELPQLMIEASKITKKINYKKNLLPNTFRQENVINSLLEITDKYLSKDN